MFLIYRTNFYFLFYCFIIYSFLGWCLEVVYHLFKQKKLVNRGFLYGPLCPIYGITAVTLVFFLSPISNNAIFIFIGGVILASIIEFITGYIMDMIFHTRWWDYSKELLNIKGYVCIKFSIIWGIIAIIFMLKIHPAITNIIGFVPKDIEEVLYNIFLILLVVDATSTIRSLIQFSILFNELHNIRTEIRLNLDHMRENTLEKAKLLKIHYRNKQLRQGYESLILNITFKHRSLLRAYPEIKSEKFQRLIEDLKEKIKK